MGPRLKDPCALPRRIYRPRLVAHFRSSRDQTPEYRPAPGILLGCLQGEATKLHASGPFVPRSQRNSCFPLYFPVGGIDAVSTGS